RVHVIERRSDEITVARKLVRQPRLHHPDVGLVRQHDALRHSRRARRVEKHRGLARTRHDGVEWSSVEEPIETVYALIAKTHRGNIRRAILRARAIAEDELCRGVAQDEMNGRARKLEALRHGDEARPHDAVISSKKFGAFGGENGHAISAPEPARAKRAGDAVRHGVELAVADLARDPAGEVDDRNLAQIAIARNEIAKVGERGHTDT